MPPSKVCPQCNAILPIRLKVCKSCQHVFRAKRQIEHTLPARAMKRLRVTLPDSMKSVIKAKDKLQKACKRAAESSEQTLHRQQYDREYRASMRAAESSEQTWHRQQQNKQHMANVREAESSEQTLHRQQQNKQHMASVREAESSEQTLHRQQQNKEHMASMRAAKKANEVCIEEAIVSFHSDIKNGPDFVCTCCHRLMYRKSVVLCNTAKYSKCSSDLLNCVFKADLRYVCGTGSEWVCKTCDRALKRGVMPVQAKANGLQLPDIPTELSGLNALEMRLICLRLPFMKMVALPCGKQRSIHGPAVNVPSKVDSICNILPRLPSQSELVPLKLKRKLAYKGHYMYDYITPQKLLDALTFLKANNPLYADIDVNTEWLETAMANDAELCECLVEQQNDGNEHDSDNCVDSPVTTSPDIAMDCSDSADPLITAMHTLETQARQNGFTIHNVPYDGECMFSAIVYQLNSSGVCDFDSITLRQAVVDYLQANQARHYCDYVCQPVDQHDDYNADTDPITQEDEFISSITDPQLQTELRWQKYVRCLQQGAWGDNIAMQAVSDMLSVTIHVLSSHYPMYSVTPQNHCATNEVFVGLIMQYHYVGLDKIPESTLPIADKPVQCKQPNQSEPASDDELDDATIAEGDEHRSKSMVPHKLA